MTFKTCTQCTQEKLLTEFRKDRNRLDGRTSHCRLCARALQSRRYQESYAPVRAVRDKKLRSDNKIRLAAVKNKGCSFCPETEHACLDFHHKDPSQKDFEIAGAVRTWGYIENEIKKCILVCSNCHRKIHAGLITCL